MQNTTKPRSDRGFAFPDPARDGVPPFPILTMSRNEVWVLAIGLGVLYVAAIILSQSGAARTDEVYHFAQIELFRNGEFRMLDRYLTTIPGYHAAVALLLKISGGDSLGAARTITALFGLAAAAAFHALRRQTQPGGEALATAQFLVVPVLAPFFFLVYTDALALALVLWATVATTRGRHWLGALVLCAALLVRQSDIIWAGFLAALAAWPEFREHRFAEPKRFALLIAPYFVPVVAFVGFWVWNGSISLSHEQALLHPVGLHGGNVLLALAVGGVLFMPQALVRKREYAAPSLAHPWFLLITPLVIAGFYFGFRADNPYNAAAPDFYVHNMIVQNLKIDRGFRFVAAVAAGVGARIFIVTPLRPAAAYWLFPIAAFFLASEWLVETRYLIVPLALWLAFREQRSKAAEYTMMALWALLAVEMFAFMIAGRAFP
ncbi:MAG TPA: hypothetical protein VH375_02885 [Rhodanobacteraceae bacterium]